MLPLELHVLPLQITHPKALIYLNPLLERLKLETQKYQSKSIC